MDQVIERGILQDPSVLGKRLIFRAVLVTVQRERILLRDISEVQGRFARDHLWVKASEDLSRFLLMNDAIYFTGTISSYKNNKVSYCVNGQWTSIRTAQSLKKFSISDIRFIPKENTPSYTKLSEGTIHKTEVPRSDKQINFCLKVFKVIYPDACAIFEDTHWVIKNDKQILYSESKSACIPKQYTQELDALTRLTAKHDISERYIVERLIRELTPITDFSDDSRCNALIKASRIHPDKYSIFRTNNGVVCVLRKTLCGNEQCQGIGCQKPKCGSFSFLI